MTVNAIIAVKPSYQTVQGGGALLIPDVYGYGIWKASLLAQCRKRLDTVGLRPQARAQAGVAPLLRNGLRYTAL